MGERTSAKSVAPIVDANAITGAKIRQVTPETKATPPKIAMKTSNVPKSGCNKISTAIGRKHNAILPNKIASDLTLWCSYRRLCCTTTRLSIKMKAGLTTSVG